MKTLATKAQEKKIVKMYRGLMPMGGISRELELPICLVTEVLHRKLSIVEFKEIEVKIRRSNNHFSVYTYIDNSVKNLIGKGMSVEEVAGVLRISEERVERIMECT